MAQKKNIEKIKKESQRLFVIELQDKTKEAFTNLLYFRSTLQESYKNQLQGFFHSVKGTSSMLEFTVLSEICNQYEALLEEANSKSEYSHKFFSILLEGVAKIIAELEVLTRSILSSNEPVKPNLSRSSTYEYLYSLVSRTILIVDDDANMIELLDKTLKDAGFFVLFTTNPSEVEEIIQNKQIDLVLCDIQMPKISGLDLCEKLLKKHIHIPFVFISSNTSLEFKLKAFTLGAKDYIVKPFDIEEFLARINNILDEIDSSKTEKFVDPETGAFNRSFFNYNFDIARNRFLDSGEHFTIAMLDLDHFKKLNQQFSYTAGDTILSEFYKRLKEYLPIESQIYRLNSDDFLVLFPGAKSNFVKGVLDEFRKSLLRKKIFFVDQPMEIKFSVGISSMFKITDTIFEVLEHVEFALAQAKKAGGNQTFVFKPGLSSLQSKLAEGFNGKILVVEDSVVLANMIRQRFESLNFIVKVAGDGEKALLFAKVFQPDVIILDLLLPTSNGFMIAESIRNDERLKDTKIILITSQNQRENVQKCVDLKLNGFIAKPFAIEELEARIESIL